MYAYLPISFLIFLSLYFNQGLSFNCLASKLQRKSSFKMSLDESTINKLDEIRSKYERLEAVVSPEAETERANLADIAEKYSTYREIKQMMAKLRTMWRTEASERRRAKQFKSFVGLFEGKLELEETLKEKLGLPFQKSIQKPKALEEILKLEAEIVSLDKKLSDVSVKLPTGKSTREERFGVLP